MSCFLFVDDKEADAKINIDELYEKRQNRDLKQLSIFKKILHRIHNKIQKTSRSKSNDRHIWFTVPEFIFGEPLYDQGDCIAYLVNILTDNKFHIRYIHPNTLFISWVHWVPSYVRSEFKKKTGKVIDEFGNIKEPAKEGEEGGAAGAGSREDDINRGMFRGGDLTGSSSGGGGAAEDLRTAKKYKPPSFIYDDDVLEKLQNRLN